MDVDQSIIDDVKCGRRTAICKTLFHNNIDLFVFDDTEYEDESNLQAIQYEYLTLVSDSERLTVKLRDSQYYEFCREDGREVMAVDNGVKFAMAQVIYIIEQRPYKLEVTY